MRRSVALVLAAALLAAASCTREATEAPGVAATPPPPDVPAIILEMVEAHGGLERWRSAPAVSFEDRFGGPGQEPLVSRVTVEQGRRRAYIDFPGTAMYLAWDGEKAWSVNWTQPYPPRFLALLNYYFLNLPWLTLDPGVRLGEPGTARLWDDPTEYVTVTMTFDPGVGDTPDDYYRLYVDPASRRLRACAYVVTYAALLPEGAESTPEHILVYDEFQEVGGLWVPTRYTIYDQDHAVYATCEISDWSFERPFDAARMTVPQDATIDASTP